MIVSDTRNFVFIHNPKCAGTTVRKALKQFDTTNDTFWMFEEVDGRMIDKAHMRMSVLQSLYPEYFNRLSLHFVFMFVRNPYTRAVSAFAEARSKGLPRATRDQPVTDMDAYVEELNAFIASLDPLLLDGWDLRYTHFARQRDMAYLGAKCMVDCIMEVEDIEASSRKLDVFDPDLRPLVLEAPRKNVRAIPLEARSLFSRSSIDRINEIYRDDFYLFDYEMW